MEQALRKIKNAELRKEVAVPPTNVSLAPAIEALTVEHQPLVLGGRYRKLSRETSQTRWVSESDFKVDTSVEAFVGEPAKVVFAARGKADYRCGKSPPSAQRSHTMTRQNTRSWPPGERTSMCECSARGGPLP